MFGLSFSHLVVVGIILLIFVGPEQLPEVARTIARFINELRRATQDFQGHFTNQFRDETQGFRDLHRQIMTPDAHPPAAPTTGHAEPTPSPDAARAQAASSEHATAAESPAVVATSEDKKS